MLLFHCLYNGSQAQVQNLGNAFAWAQNFSQICSFLGFVDCGVCEESRLHFYYCYPSKSQGAKYAFTLMNLLLEVLCSCRTVYWDHNYPRKNMNKHQNIAGLLDIALNSSIMHDNRLINLYHFFLGEIIINSMWGLFADGMLFINLPDGPTAHFNLSSLVLRKDIKVIMSYLQSFIFLKMFLSTMLRVKK
jgi:hypothetical protein